LNNKFESDRKVFLESFPGWKTFQTFPEHEGLPGKLIRQVSVKQDQYPFDVNPTIESIPVNIIQGLEKLNSMKACISLTINETDGKGRKKENIKRVRACWADMDGVPLPKTWEEEPSIIVETSPGRYHVYYLTDDVPLESFKTLQEGIAQYFGSDPQNNDLTKCLRMPGFYHQKKEPFLVRIVQYSGLKFSFGLLCELFPPVQRKQWSSPKYQTPVNFDVNQEFKGSYGSSQGSRNGDMVKIIGGMLKNKRPWSYIESECFKHNACSNPPLSDSEVFNILKSCKRYA
jgi:hypothetical protein